ncbi:DHHC family palmitoyltransferase [Sporobolomyces salmoneus]|uniref:DHHC family palmitoyltransferase n=1 Tax=Sporobolomyces salmoneus TaxID=183962 RepID=UPI003176FCDF
MLPPRRAPAPAAPLLTFPPSPPTSSTRQSSPLPPIDHSSSFSLLSSTSQQHKRRKTRSLCYRTLSAVPLGFIYALLLFSFYAVAYSLSFDYLFRSKGEKLKAIGVWISYFWLLYGCGGSLWMCYYRSDGNFVKLDEHDQFEQTARDEEEGIRGGGGRVSQDVEEMEDEEETEQHRLLEGSRAGKEPGGATGTMQVKSDGTKRFCRKCNILKPDRAHHCSTCQRCVLKMDHHCPWLGGGCAGYANYKFFLLFLLYTGALGIYIACVCFYSLVNYTSNEPSGFEMAPISWALAALFGIIFGSATGLFGLYHLYLAANNRTTIEAMESPTTFQTTLPPPHLVDMIAPQPHSQRRNDPRGGPKAPSIPSRAQVIQQLHSRLNPKQKLRLNRAKRRYNIYDIGWRGNLKEIFTRGGDEKARRWTTERGERGNEGGIGGRPTTGRWWEWMVPWGEPAGDGYSFPINLENLRKLEEVSREIWAEVEADERERSSRGDLARGRYESGLTREGTFDGESGSERSGSEDDETPLRRA